METEINFDLNGQSAATGKVECPTVLRDCAVERRSASAD
jgi:hypothetical protein